MCIIIRNILITLNDLLIFEKHFGECQSFSGSSSIFAGFISALNTFSGEFTESSLRSINYEDFKIYLYKESDGYKLLYVLIADSLDEEDEILAKMKRISSIFNDLYYNQLKTYNGKIWQFNNFGKILIETNIAQRNCGENPDCNTCLHRKKDSKIIEAFKNKKIKDLTN